MKLFALWLFIIVLAAFGMLCVLYPEFVQSAALRFVARGVTARMPRLRAFIQSPSYLAVVRTVGAGALLMAAGLLWGATGNLYA